MALPKRSVRDLYDHSAAKWVRRDPVSLSDFTARAPVLEMCQPAADLRVLDLGCGEGYCSRALRRSGAAAVDGLDISVGMIQQARSQEEREPLGIHFHEGCAADLSRFPDGSFDLVVAMFLFNYMNLEQTRSTMRQVARKLAPDGRFIFAVPHPAFPFLRQAAPPFYFNVGGAGYFSARDEWYPGRIWKRDGSWLEVQLCHKTFEDYFQLLREAGLRSTLRVRELRVTVEMVKAEPSFFGPLVDTPLHLALEVGR